VAKVRLFVKPFPPVSPRRAAINPGGSTMNYALRALALVACLFVAACGSIPLDPSLLNKRPEAELEKVEIDAISLRDVTFLFRIAVKNPFPLGLSLAGVRMRFAVENNQLFATETRGGLNVPAKGKESTTFLVTVKYEDIEKAARNYMARESLDCAIAGEIVVKLPTGGIKGLPGTWEFPFTFSKKIPTIKPVVRIVNFKVTQPSRTDIEKDLRRIGKETLSPDKIAGLFGDMLSGKKKQPLSEVVPADLDVKFGVSFSIELENKTPAKIAFRTLDYGFAINNAKLIDGTTKSIVSTGNKSVLNISNQFSSRALGDSIVKAFMDRKGAFTFRGRTSLQLPAGIKKEPVRLDFNESGTLSF